jgi:predicted double-glycine peptidase
MDQFRLLNQTRQSTEYSCGASALRSVLSYWGSQVDEAELIKLLGTSEDVGTYPEDIVRGARALGFDAEAVDNLTLDAVQKFTATGSPMIALGQVWRSRQKSNTSVIDDWDDGHYIVVLGVDQDYVYFQDPYIRMSKGFVPRGTFEALWHQAMGGDLVRNPKLLHLGIFIRGKEPAPSKPAKELDISAIDYQKMGSMNLIVTQFHGVLLPYDFLDELRDIWKTGNVRPNAFILLTKDENGRISGLEGSALQEEGDEIAINALVAVIASSSITGFGSSLSRAQAAVKAATTGDFGLSADDIRRVAQNLLPNHSAIIGLFENVWERRFKEVAGKHGGGVIDQRLISPDALAKAAGQLIAAGGTDSA